MESTTPRHPRVTIMILLNAILGSIPMASIPRRGKKPYTIPLLFNKKVRGLSVVDLGKFITTHVPDLKEWYGQSRIIVTNQPIEDTEDRHCGEARVLISVVSKGEVDRYLALEAPNGRMFIGEVGGTHDAEWFENQLNGLERKVWYQDHIAFENLLNPVLCAAITWEAAPEDQFDWNTEPALVSPLGIVNYYADKVFETLSAKLPIGPSDVREYSIGLLGTDEEPVHVYTGPRHIGVASFNAKEQVWRYRNLKWGTPGLVPTANGNKPVLPTSQGMLELGKTESARKLKVDGTKLPTHLWAEKKESVRKLTLVVNNGKNTEVSTFQSADGGINWTENFEVRTPETRKNKDRRPRNKRVVEIPVQPAGDGTPAAPPASPDTPEERTGADRENPAA